MCSGGRTAVWKHCRGYQEEGQEKRNGTWGTIETIAHAHICRPVIERDDGIPDLATLVKTNTDGGTAARSST